MNLRQSSFQEENSGKRRDFLFSFVVIYKFAKKRQNGESVENSLNRARSVHEDKLHIRRGKIRTSLAQVKETNL